MAETNPDQLTLSEFCAHAREQGIEPHQLYAHHYPDA